MIDKDNNGQANILLIESDSVVQKELKKILSSININLILSETKNEALKMALIQDLCGIVIDVNLASENDFQLLRLITEDYKTSKYPIVLISAYNQNISKIIKSFSQATIDYITKPFDKELITNKLAKLFHLKQQNEVFENGHVDEVSFINLNSLEYDKITSKNEKIYFCNIVNDWRYNLNDFSVGIICVKNVNSISASKSINILKDIDFKIKSEFKNLIILHHLSANKIILFLDHLISAKQASEKIKNLLSIPISIGNEKFKVLYSIVFSELTSNQTAEKLYDQLHQQLELPQQNKLELSQINNDGFSNKIIRKIQIENLLKKAIEREEFYIFYQPIYNLKNNKVFAVECLLRWNNNEIGTISPYEFIPIAENSGFITKITRWIIKETIEIVAHWQQDALFEVPDVCINLTMIDLLSPDLNKYFQEQLKRNKIAPHKIYIEVSEMSIMDNISLAINKLDAIRKIGIKASIDDFGTGFSSLSQLQKIKVDFIKIDRSFIETNNTRVINAIVSLAKQFNFQLIAEGIENQEQYNFLKSLNCDYGQGYFFKKPMSILQLEEYLRNNISYNKFD